MFRPPGPDYLDPCIDVVYLSSDDSRQKGWGRGRRGETATLQHQIISLNLTSLGFGLGHQPDLMWRVKSLLLALATCHLTQYRGKGEYRAPG